MEYIDRYLNGESSSKDNKTRWKNICQEHHKEDPDPVRFGDWKRLSFDNLDESQKETLFNKLRFLPTGTWLLSVKFNLKTPFYSRSEDPIPIYRGENRKGEFTYTENFTYRDRLTGGMEVKPSTWKGNMLNAARWLDMDKNSIRILFGEKKRFEKGSKDSGYSNKNGSAGNLFFFPTIFTGREIDNRVITPLSWVSGTPIRGPIWQKYVGEGASGEFLLLFSPIHSKVNKEELQVSTINALSAVETMLFETGFSARRTKGWGIAEKKLNVHFAITGRFSRKRAEIPEEYRLFFDLRGSLLSRLSREMGGLLGYKKFQQRCEDDDIHKDITKTKYNKLKKYYNSMAKQPEGGDNYINNPLSRASNTIEELRRFLRSIEYV